MKASKTQILRHLEAVKDPEIPVLDIVEMGIVRDVEVSDNSVLVVITPTYSGCPAMKTIEDEIVAVLNERGYDNVTTKTIFSPTWTTEWLNDETRAKLKAYGISPPERLTGGTGTKKVCCPFCDSARTELRSEFGSTACKALYYCQECEQPFEHFKCI